MNINAKQINSLDVTRMDVTTALGFFSQVKNLIAPDMTLTATLSGTWGAFVAALAAVAIHRRQIPRPHPTPAAVVAVVTVVAVDWMSKSIDYAKYMLNSHKIEESAGRVSQFFRNFVGKA